MPLGNSHRRNADRLIYFLSVISGPKNGGIQMATLAVVTLWRCHCGANIKVFGEAEVANPRASQVVACPKCGQKQLVYVDRIVSIDLGTTDQLSFDPATAP